VQSGSDRILGMMKRGYTQAQYLDKIRRLRQARPDLGLSSDFIIGFPSETEEDFEQTMALIEQARVDSAYSFIYSARPGTPAANLRDNIPVEVKERRLERLQTRIRQLGDEFARKLVGTTQTVLVERTARDPGQLSGKTPCNRPLNFQGPESLIGQFVKVHVAEALTNSLRGRLVGPA